MFANLLQIAITQMMCSDLTCMTVSHPACFSVSEAMWAEVENEVVVVRKHPEPQVNQITELVHCFDICVCSTEMRKRRQTLNATFPPLMIQTAEAVSG